MEAAERLARFQHGVVHVRSAEKDVFENAGKRIAWRKGVAASDGVLEQVIPHGVAEEMQVLLTELLVVLSKPGEEVSHFQDASPEGVAGGCGFGPV